MLAPSSCRLAARLHLHVKFSKYSVSQCSALSCPCWHLSAALGFQHVPREEKQTLVGQVFASVAPSYDIMNDLMSGGLCGAAARPARALQWLLL